MTLFFGLLTAATLAGCTIAEQDATSVGDNFQRGIQGQGRIVPHNATSDSFGPEFR